MYDYDEHAIIRVTDTYTGEQAIITSDEQMRQVLEGWEDMSEPGVEEAVDALADGGTRDTDVIDLGIQVDELDPDDVDEVSDDEWAEWICSGWLAGGRVWDDGRVIISDYRPPMHVVGEWEWQGGPVSVRSHHGDQEQRWRHVTSLADLRRTVEAASAEEAVWEDEQARRLEDERAEEAPLRDLAARLIEAQRQVDALVAERARLVAERPGWTGVRLARSLGVSEMMVSKIRKRSAE